MRQCNWGPIGRQEGSLSPSASIPSMVALPERRLSMKTFSFFFLFDLFIFLSFPSYLFYLVCPLCLCPRSNHAPLDISHLVSSIYPACIYSQNSAHHSTSFFISSPLPIFFGSQAHFSSGTLHPLICVTTTIVPLTSASPMFFPYTTTTMRKLKWREHNHKTCRQYPSPSTNQQTLSPLLCFDSSLPFFLLHSTGRERLLRFVISTFFFFVVAGGVKSRHYDHLGTCTSTPTSNQSFLCSWSKADENKGRHFHVFEFG